MKVARRATIIGAVALAALAVPACGEDAGSPAGGSSDGAVAANGESVVVQAVDNSFVPETETVAAGTEVVWENRGRNEHNIIPESEDAEWRFEAEAFVPGAEVSHVFTEPGTYRYYCSIHGTIDAGMPGVIVVE